MFRRPSPRPPRPAAVGRLTRRARVARTVARAVAGGLAVVTAAGAVAGAQAPRPAGCGATATLTPVGEGVDTVYLAVGRAPEADTLAPVFASSVLDAVADGLVLPPAMVGEALGMAARRAGDATPPLFRPDFGVALLVELRRDGRVARVRAAQRSLVDAADAALVRAVTTADTTHSFFARDRGPGTLPVIVRLTLLPDSAEVRRAVGVLRQPRYRGESDARLLTPLPEPESAAAREGIFSGSEVAFEYVIDVTGRPVEGTERLVRYSNPALAGELYRWLRDQARWAPARVAGCPVRQLVRERFTYRGSGGWFTPR